MTLLLNGSLLITKPPALIRSLLERLHNLKWFMGPEAWTSAYVTGQHVAAAAATHLGSGATYEDYMQLLRVGDSRYLCDIVNDESSAIEPIGTRILRTAGQVRNACSIRRLLQEGSTPVSSLGYSCRLCFTARQLNPPWSAVKMAMGSASQCVQPEMHQVTGQPTVQLRYTLSAAVFSGAVLGFHCYSHLLLLPGMATSPWWCQGSCGVLEVSHLTWKVI